MLSQIPLKPPYIRSRALRILLITKTSSSKAALGTWRGGRTLTLVKELDFESSASANSAIQARYLKLMSVCGGFGGGVKMRI